MPATCPKCRYIDLTGKRFSRLTVVKKGKIDKNGHRYWVCKCDCGSIKEVSGSNLIENKTLSCGCFHKELTSENHLTDLVGKDFGFLTVIKRIGTIGDKVKYLCKCNNCGNTTIVSRNNLSSGHTISCGCIKSVGEHFIRKYLLENNISFKTEYIFKELPNRRFDFAIFKENILFCLIEYDGKQHFNYINTWHKNEQAFLDSQERDRQKDEWCEKSGIKLYRISYKDNIEDKLNVIIKEIQDA